MLPVGLWLGDTGEKRVNDKLVKMVELAIPAEEAQRFITQKRKRAAQQAELLRVLCETGRVAATELCKFTGAGIVSLRALERLGLVRMDEETVFRYPKYTRGEEKT